MESDITIIGAGLAGLIASIRFSQLNHSVICVDYKGEKDNRNDLRTTALLLPSVKILKEIGVWEQIKAFSCPLTAMRICDLSYPSKPKEVEFHASEINERHFGFNIHNQILYKQLIKLVKTSKNIKLIDNDKFTNIRTRTDANFIELKSGAIIKSKLLIGADGRSSSVRDKLNIPIKTKSYNQLAIAFKVSHKKNHNNVSIETHQSGGPFTIVPLNNQNESAVIWMDKAVRIRNILKLKDAQFEQAITERSGNYLGPLDLISDLNTWPIINQHAKFIVKERCVLIAEAAHVLPPIGAQGLNMSIQDINSLANIVGENHDPGLSNLLYEYEKRRDKNSKLRIKLIDALNLSSISSMISTQKVRSLAIQLIASSPKLKNLLINTGLGD